MSCGSFLFNREFDPVWILLVQSVFGPFELEVVTKWFNATISSQKRINLSGFATLLLLDISQVGPAENAYATENEYGPTFRLVVETVWFIPIGEFSDILMSIWSFIAWLHITWNAKFIKT
tara:strand:- start:225 stop:584 length:360 start_codon:yes stop_codon:yes gene_type:complete